MKRFSILMDEMDHCFVCHAKNNLHIHEVFYGTANRKKSIKYGCCVSLCPRHHNMSNAGVHFNKELDLRIKQVMQKKFEEVYPNLDFIKEFGRNYL